MKRTAVSSIFPHIFHSSSSTFFDSFIYLFQLGVMLVGMGGNNGWYEIIK